MKRFVYSGIVCAGAALCAMVISSAVGQSPVVPGGTQVKSVRPRQPGGLLGDALGTYRTIEGVLYDGRQEKVESNTLLVDTVDGKKLEKPIGILIRNVRHVPAKTRCVFKGYETGEMIGYPDAIYAAAAEQGRTEKRMSPKSYSWRPYFVVLIAVEPQGLELREE